MSLMRADLEMRSEHVLDRLRTRLPHLRQLIRSDQPIAKLGLDSIDFVELLCVIESEFNIMVRDEDLAGAETVGMLAELICARARARDRDHDHERQVQS